MCGIVGAVTERDVKGILLEGLKRLEYRGYDSAGLSLLSSTGNRINTVKAVGKVAKLIAAADKAKVRGKIGIAHTRWATHGKPTVANAHPHNSNNEVSIVHNGIIENFEPLRSALEKSGYKFKTQTDTEVIAHLIHKALRGGKVDLVTAVQKTIKKLHGAYGVCVMDLNHPDQIVVARSGSPLVIGVGIGENFIASDPLALGQVTDRFIYLEEGDVARVSLESVEIWQGGRKVKRKTTTVHGHAQEADKGEFKHFMLKEIYEQPQVIQDTLDGRISEGKVLEAAFGVKGKGIFDKVKSVQIVACGTSFHAGLVTKYWLESIAKIPCQVDIGSDYRYREIIVQPGTLFLTISQSGETADTLAALKYSKGLG